MKKYVYGFIALSSVVSTSFALNPFNKFITQPHNNITAKVTKKSAAKSDFTNFSGTWSGKCSGSDEEMTFTVKNDEYSFEVDNELTFIGGNMLQTKTDSSSYGSFADHNSLFWNEDKSQLIFNSVFLGKAFFPIEGEQNNPLTTAIIAGNLSLENDKLMLKMNSVAFLGTEEMEKQPAIVCTFERQAG